MKIAARVLIIIAIVFESACLFALLCAVVSVLWDRHSAYIAAHYGVIAVVMLMGIIIASITLKSLSRNEKKIVLGIFCTIFASFLGGIFYLLWNPSNKESRERSRATYASSSPARYTASRTDAASRKSAANVNMLSVGQKVKNVTTIYVDGERIPTMTEGIIKSIEGDFYVVQFTCWGAQVDVKAKRYELCTSDGNEPADPSLSQQSSNPSNEKLDKFDEISRYKELLDKGVITEEDFAKKKKELLDL